MNLNTKNFAAHNPQLKKDNKSVWQIMSQHYYKDHIEYYAGKHLIQVFISKLNLLIKIELLPMVKKYLHMCKQYK